jgi:hypothetical protein
MTTKAATIYEFWNSFKMPAHEENSVPTGEDAPKFPYITYQLVTDSLGNEVAMSASLWYRGTSWVEANAKTEEISQRIGRKGAVLDCNGGKVWIKRGTPFAQNMGDESDNLIKRKYLNITAEYLTAD